MRPKSKLHWSLDDNKVIKRGFYVWALGITMTFGEEPQLVPGEFFAYKWQAKERKEALVRSFGFPMKPYIQILKVFVKDWKKNER